MLSKRILEIIEKKIKFPGIFQNIFLKNLKAKFTQLEFNIIETKR